MKELYSLFISCDTVLVDDIVFVWRLWSYYHQFKPPNNLYSQLLCLIILLLWLQLIIQLIKINDYPGLFKKWSITIPYNIGLISLEGDCDYKTPHKLRAGLVYNKNMHCLHNTAEELHWPHYNQTLTNSNSGLPKDTDKTSDPWYYMETLSSRAPALFHTQQQQMSPGSTHPHQFIKQKTSSDI